MSRIFTLHFGTKEGGGDTLTIFIYVNHTFDKHNTLQLTQIIEGSPMFSFFPKSNQQYLV